MTTENAAELAENTTPDVLSMSDEDFAKQDPSFFEQPATPDPATTEDEVGNAEAAAAKDDDEAGLPDEAKAESGNPADSEDAAAEKASAASPLSAADDEEIVTKKEAETKTEDTATNKEATGKDDAGEEKKEDKKDEAGDYEAQVKKILSPFNANGREIQVDSVDDAITLMKMGANYNKKMAVLKPSLKIMKMLDNNGLLDEAKINNLIDLSKNNPAAIQKLVKDSGMDPLEIDVKKESEYTPSTYNVADEEVEIDNVLTELEGSTSFRTTLDIIGNKLDEPSKKVLAQNPGIIRVINEHVELGYYDQIQAGVDKGRMLGHLEGLNDLEAYKKVGDAMHAQGAFAPKAGKEETAAPVTTKPVDKVAEEERKTRKQAASATKPGASTKPAVEEIDPLSMSDEEFEAMSAKKYM